MAGRYTLLSTSLRDELQTHIGGGDIVIERRLLPRRDRTEFADGKTYVSVFAGAAGFEIIGRQVDKEDWQAVIAIQAAGPDPNASAGANPFGHVTQAAADPVAWGDTVFDFVEQVKGLWRAETTTRPAGPLRDKLLAGCHFIGLEHDPVYVPFHLEELGILSILLQLDYRVVDEDEDED